MEFVKNIISIIKEKIIAPIFNNKKLLFLVIGAIILVIVMIGIYIYMQNKVTFKIKIPDNLISRYKQVKNPTNWKNEGVTAVKNGRYKIPIPKGYRISEESANNAKEGFIIVDEYGNEWVWIPVSERWDIRNDLDNSDTVIDNNNNIYKEPVILTDSITLEGELFVCDSQETLNYYYGENYYNYNQDFNYGEDYTKMIVSINKYAGFYVGRYETTITDDGQISVRNNEKVVHAGNKIYNHEDYSYRWWGLYKEQKNMLATGNGETVQIGMIWGKQWDAVVDFINGKSDGKGNSFSIKTSSGERHLGYREKSGQNIADKVCNIYDLEGNLQEWTLEADCTNSTKTRVIRSGDYQGTFGAVTYRTYSGPGSVYNGIGTRAQLYIK